MSDVQQPVMLPSQSLMPDTPALWFDKRFPNLAEIHGEAVSEETTKDGKLIVKNLSEDFFAATLGEIGSPASPTVFLPSEARFYRYDPAIGIFLERREEALGNALSQLLLESARACREGCNTERLSFAMRKSSRLASILSRAKGLLAVRGNYFAHEETEFIACANGMLRLSDKALSPFSPSFRRRNKLAVEFLPSAKAPLFLETLMRPALSEADLDLLQRWCGLALIGKNLAQKILILSGTAGGGKGTFIRVLQGIIGAINVGTLRTQQLTERFEIGRFLDKTLLYGADVPEDFLNCQGASVLKSLTGGDPLSVEFKGSNERPEIISQFNVIVTCNSRLVVRLEGDTGAWKRRLVIIEYKNPPPQEKIVDLSEQIIRNEASGVLNWMLEGLEKVRADRWQLHLSQEQQKTVNNLLLESDSHTVFAEQCLEKDISASLTIADCFCAYGNFCFEKAWAPISKNRFGNSISDVVLRRLGISLRHDITGQDGKRNQRGWKGIRLRFENSEQSGQSASELSEGLRPDDSDNFFAPARL